MTATVEIAEVKGLAFKSGKPRTSDIEGLQYPGKNNQGNSVSSNRSVSRQASKKDGTNIGDSEVELGNIPTYSPRETKEFPTGIVQVVGGEATGNS